MLKFESPSMPGMTSIKDQVGLITMEVGVIFGAKMNFCFVSVLGFRRNIYWLLLKETFLCYFRDGKDISAFKTRKLWNKPKNCSCYNRNYPE